MTLQNVVVRGKLGEFAEINKSWVNKCQILIAGGSMFSQQISGKVMTMLFTIIHGL